MVNGDGSISRRGLVLGAAGLLALGSRPAAAAVLGPVPFRPAGSGRYTAADRPFDGIRITHIVIHDTEETYDDTLTSFAKSADGVGAAAHYVIRSADGAITQVIRDADIAYHSGNFWYNMHSIGIEHEGFLSAGARWYTDAQYRASAALVRELAARHGVALDRDHILGHEEIPAAIPENSTKQHFDPGPFWDWEYYFRLLRAPLYERADDPDSRVVAIATRFADNRAPLVDSDAGGAGLPPQPCNVVYLHSEPDERAPLIGDPALHPDGSAGTTATGDWSARAVVGQRFAVADRRGDWTAIWFGGRIGWFADPDRRIGAPAAGQVITPAPGRAQIPVFGTAYPEHEAFGPLVVPDDIVPLQYRIDAGQCYVATGRHRSDDYQPTTALHDLRVHVVGRRRLVEISYNHRRALVDAADIRYLD